MEVRALYGTATPPPAIRRIEKGRLRFDLVDGNLRSICVDGTEVLRAIQYLLRDRDWGTVPPLIRDLRIDPDRDEIRIAYSADCIDPDGGRLAYAARIMVRDDSIDFTVEARAIDDLRINRLGFCVLHPAALAGHPLRIAHGDGSATTAVFPALIAPWQPFTDIRTLVHQQDGLTVSCRVEGDTYEMEDQRNWSDASYKTYARPLALPWPYAIAAGTTCRHAVRVDVTGAQRRPLATAAPIRITIGPPIGTMPRIGLVITPDTADSSVTSRDALCDLGVQDLLLSYNASAGDGAAEMKGLARAVSGLPHRLTLECVIAATGDLDAELSAVADQAKRAGLQLDAVAVYPAPDLQSTPPGSPWPACPPPADIQAAARRAFPGLRIGGGAFGYFTELNRKRPPLQGLDFVSHATCPIVHAADDLSVMQSLAAIAPILRSARAFLGETAYRLGPVTIGMRQNPYGARTMPNPARERVPMAMVDPRQDGQFAAAWTIGYAAATEAGGIELLTFGTLTGPLGLIGRHGRRPLFAAIAALAGCAGRMRFACVSSHPDTIQAVATASAVIVANLTAEARMVVVDGRRVALAPFAVATMRMDRDLPPTR
ncbi:hypothetical protein [Polymorphobacter fuscus]|nr:hypothetical protein [Polymorphobacter fuscus]